MSGSHIPFVNSLQDAKLVTKFYGESRIARVSIDAKDSLIGELPSQMDLWVDTAIDAYHNGGPKNNGRLSEIFWALEGHEEFCSKDFQENPKAAVVEPFVYELLDKCQENRPKWISVPQLPVPNNSGINALNRGLAKAAGKWRTERGFNGEFVLPVIITHDDQVHYKQKRTSLIKLAMACRDRSSAEGYWVVHSGLDDQAGSLPNEKKRFPGLIAFHQELRNKVLPSGFVIGGPYWGMNLVLWARGLVDYPAIGVGSGYRYFISGGVLMQGKTRISLPPLRRLAVATKDLEAWLEKARVSQPKGSPIAREFEKLRKLTPQLMRSKEGAKRQVAKAYREWIEKIEQVPDGGRALALYQDLSEAYVIGKSLENKLPKDEKVTRPERIAQQLMMSCL